jgi:hypothetical protein
MGTHAPVNSRASDADEAPSLMPGVANMSQSGGDADYAWRPTYIFQDAHRASRRVIVISDEPGTSLHSRSLTVSLAVRAYFVVWLLDQLSECLGMFLCCCLVLSHGHPASSLWWLGLRELSGHP